VCTDVYILCECALWCALMCGHRSKSWDVGGRDSPDFGVGSWRLQGVVDGSRNIIIAYHVLEVYSKVVTFEEK